MRDVEIVYNGRDNHIELQLLENNRPLTDLSGLTRVVLTLGASSIDTDSTPDLIDWSAGHLVIKAGHAGLAAGKYTGRIETYDPDNPNGLVWTEALHIIIRN